MSSGLSVRQRSEHSAIFSSQHAMRRKETAPPPPLWRQLLPPLLLFFALVFQLSVRLTAIEGGYELERLRRSALKNDARLRELRLSYACLERPDALAQQAKDLLKMVAVTPQRIRRLQ